MQTSLVATAGKPGQTCDIFCHVIDNFGDIGVCWRLARQLAAEHAVEVRLWIDDLVSFHRLCPEADPQAEIQCCSNVKILRWAKPFPDVAPADVVIEAFGCRLPESYQAAMAQRASRPVWINLEYLSAENWVEGCHGMISPHPRLPLTKHFFFPGFTPATGGLLREKDLLSRRDAAQRTSESFLHWLNLPPPEENETLVSLFCYDTAPVADLLSVWETSAIPVRCLLPEGTVVLAQVSAWFGCSRPVKPGDTLQRGNLTLHVLPFLRQEDYDRLLWACDCNFVRGEDSFVRAQWAARPMVWQIYMQEENTHLVKLNAFLDRYCSELDGEAAAALRDFHRGWNSGGALLWNDLLRHRAALQAHAAAWAHQLSAEPDLASKLVIFCKNQV